MKKRTLNLTKKQLKKLFNKNAIDFADSFEKLEFNHFNIASIYKLKLNNKDENICSYCGKENYLEFSMLSKCRYCRKEFLEKDNLIFEMEFIHFNQAKNQLKLRGINHNVEIFEEKVLFMN